MRIRVIASVLIVSLSSGCAGLGGQNQQTGTVIGAVAGATAGAFFGRGAGRLIGVAVGSIVGGIIGNQIGQYLDDRDKQALAATSRQALLTGTDNAPQAWASDHSGATATVVTTNSRTESRQIDVVRPRTVAPAAHLDVVGAPAWTRTAATVHAGPGKDSAVLAELPVGARVYEIGRVDSHDWVLLARNGVAIGYVEADTVADRPTAQVASNPDAHPVLRPAKANANATAPRPAMPSGAAARLDAAAVRTASADATVSPGRPQPYDLDAQDSAPIRSVADLDALGPDIAVDKVTTAVACRDIVTTVAAGGQTSSDKQIACKSPDGSWNLM